MGNTANKTKGDRLSADEKKLVVRSFKYLCKHGDEMKDDDLQKIWSSQVDPHFAMAISNFLFGWDDRVSHWCDFDRFAELYVYCTRGTSDERLYVLNACMALGVEDGDVPYQLLLNFVTYIITSYLKVLQLQNNTGYSSWIGVGFKQYSEYAEQMAEGLVCSVANLNSGLRQSNICNWMNQNPALIKMMSHICSHLYHYLGKTVSNSGQSPRASDSFDQLNVTDMMPVCTGLQYIPDYPGIIDLTQLLFLSTNLPPDCQAEWRFLFSSQLHGDSFSTFLGRVLDQGPSVIIIEDEDGFVFGGFASVSWSLGPKFTGNDTSFLYTLNPKMRCFQPTGYNSNFQYINLFQQTLPNGLGMGGQFDYFGLYLSNEYGSGMSSESCSTFKDYKMLSKKKEFKVKHIEVWGVGPKPVSADETGERRNASVLDGNYETKAILALAGKEQHSEGLREPPNDIPCDTRQ